MKIKLADLKQIIKEEVSKLRTEQVERIEDPIKTKMNKNDKLGDSDKAMVYKTKGKQEMKSAPNKEMGGFDETSKINVEKGSELNLIKDEGSDKQAAAAVSVDAGSKKSKEGNLKGQASASFKSKKDNPEMKFSEPFDDKKFDGKMNTEDKVVDKEAKTFVEAGKEKSGKTHTAGQPTANIKEKAPVVKDKAPIATGIEIKGTNYKGTEKKDLKENYTKTELLNFIKEEARKIAKNL